MLVLRYHDQTKHHFDRFARSRGYLDWATQPDPFRRYIGAPTIELLRDALADTVPYEALFDGSAEPAPVSERSIGEFLRCSVGLSAWKQYGASRWALRVNPSSGNLHPTETYLIRDGRVYHYVVREHALEERCAFDASGEEEEAFLVALTSIHWREAWKYGERAFRYCQHDAGHAIGALRLAAALLGWRLALMPRWSDAQLSTLLGLDRDQDYTGAEREEPECLAIVAAQDPSRWLERDPSPLAEAASRGSWRGTANRLSADHAEWPIIDEVSVATRYPGRSMCDGATVRGAAVRVGSAMVQGSTVQGSTVQAARSVAPSHPRTHARSVILARRSALAFDGRGVLERNAFFSMLHRLRPPAPPWDAIDWLPQVHLVLFVHRVQELVPGVYAYLRDDAARAEWQAAMRQEFLWEPLKANDPNDPNGLFLLVPIDCRRLANRLSCDQEIAEDGFFSLAMVARLEASLRERGEWFYRRLFWECGLIGQVLYLDAEAAGARATGIGCFYDDPVHEMLGLTGHAWQSLYHFSMGVPVEDTRLTSEPGYAWEQVAGPGSR
ncbi:MAG: SagB/ThcOx family dehydrogenase [Acidobacteria bacterium]|nr:SagB/ThcOx family dehydrogenase [Acidobacteriota bacterium]